MKQAKSGLHLLLMILSTYALIGCNGHSLSRNKAKSDIIREHKYPQIETMELEKVYIKSHSSSAPGGWLPKACLVSGPRYSTVKDVLSHLEQNGMITVSENGPIGDCSILQAVVKLTPAGQKYLVQETKDKWVVSAAQISFREVTGIQTFEQFNAAEVVYTVAVDPTPFSPDQSRSNRERSATFGKYDDGWRTR